MRHSSSCLWFGLLLLAGCTVPVASTATTQTITLVTTTTTQDSGLIGMLVPMFRKETGIEVKVIAVGSGQALEIGRHGDADVVLTHSPSAEKEFVNEGFGEQRIPVFYNDFLLIGPVDGPMAASPPQSLDEAFRRLAVENLLFLSRGDDSGTHRKELQLWEDVDIKPDFSNYLRTGAGMAQTLRIAQEKQAFTLTDRGTYLAMSSELHLPIYLEGDPRLRNSYAVMVISPAKHPHVHAEPARKFAAFLRSKSTQDAIAEFGKEKFGQSLFHPEATDAPQ